MTHNLLCYGSVRVKTLLAGFCQQKSGYDLGVDLIPVIEEAGGVRTPLVRSMQRHNE